MPGTAAVSAFTGVRGRDGFLRACDSALDRLWPVPVDARDVPTSAGTVRLYRAGPPGDDPVVLLSGANGNVLGGYRHVAGLACPHCSPCAAPPRGLPRWSTGRCARTS